MRCVDSALATEGKSGRLVLARREPTLDFPAIVHEQMPRSSSTAEELGHGLATPVTGKDDHPDLAEVQVVAEEEGRLVWVFWDWVDIETVLLEPQNRSHLRNAR
jgi:hypothetical protein